MPGFLATRRVKDLGSTGNCGDAARSAAEDWRFAAAKLLLEAPAGARSTDHQWLVMVS